MATTVHSRRVAGHLFQCQGGRTDCDRAATFPSPGTSTSVKGIPASLQLRKHGEVLQALGAVAWQEKVGHTAGYKDCLPVSLGSGLPAP